jgi:hypothetical protein
LTLDLRQEQKTETKLCKRNMGEILALHKETKDKYYFNERNKMLNTSSPRGTKVILWNASYVSGRKGETLAL